MDFGPWNINRPYSTSFPPPCSNHEPIMNQTISIYESIISNARDVDTSHNDIQSNRPKAVEDFFHPISKNPNEYSIQDETLLTSQEVSKAGLMSSSHQADICKTQKLEQDKPKLIQSTSIVHSASMNVPIELELPLDPSISKKGSQVAKKRCQEPILPSTAKKPAYISLEINSSKYQFSKLHTLADVANLAVHRQFNHHEHRNRTSNQSHVIEPHHHHHHHQHIQLSADLSNINSHQHPSQNDMDSGHVEIIEEFQRVDIIDQNGLLPPPEIPPNSTSLPSPSWLVRKDQSSSNSVQREILLDSNRDNPIVITVLENQLLDDSKSTTGTNMNLDLVGCSQHNLVDGEKAQPRWHSFPIDLDHHNKTRVGGRGEIDSNIGEIKIDTFNLDSCKVNLNSLNMNEEQKLNGGDQYYSKSSIDSPWCYQGIYTLAKQCIDQIQDHSMDLNWISTEEESANLNKSLMETTNAVQMNEFPNAIKKVESTDCCIEMNQNDSNVQEKLHQTSFEEQQLHSIYVACLEHEFHKTPSIKSERKFSGMLPIQSDPPLSLSPSIQNSANLEHSPSKMHSISSRLDQEKRLNSTFSKLPNASISPSNLRFPDIQKSSALVEPIASKENPMEKMIFGWKTSPHANPSTISLGIGICSTPSKESKADFSNEESNPNSSSTDSQIQSSLLNPDLCKKNDPMTRTKNGIERRMDSKPKAAVGCGDSNHLQSMNLIPFSASCCCCHNRHYGTVSAMNMVQDDLNIEGDHLTKLMGNHLNPSGEDRLIRRLSPSPIGEIKIKSTHSQQCFLSAMPTMKPPAGSFPDPINPNQIFSNPKNPTSPFPCYYCSCCQSSTNICTQTNIFSNIIHKDTFSPSSKTPQKSPATFPYPFNNCPCQSLSSPLYMNYISNPWNESNYLQEGNSKIMTPLSKNDPIQSIYPGLTNTTTDSLYRASPLIPLRYLSSPFPSSPLLDLTNKNNNISNSSCWWWWRWWWWWWPMTLTNSMPMWMESLDKSQQIPPIFNPLYIQQNRRESLNFPTTSTNRDDQYLNSSNIGHPISTNVMEVTNGKQVQDQNHLLVESSSSNINITSSKNNHSPPIQPTSQILSSPIPLTITHASNPTEPNCNLNGNGHSSTCGKLSPFTWFNPSGGIHSHQPLKRRQSNGRKAHNQLSTTPILPSPVIPIQLPSIPYSIHPSIVSSNKNQSSSISTTVTTNCSLTRSNSQNPIAASPPMQPIAPIPVPTISSNFSSNAGFSANHSTVPGNTNLNTTNTKTTSLVDSICPNTINSEDKKNGTEKVFTTSMRVNHLAQPSILKSPATKNQNFLRLSTPIQQSIHSISPPIMINPSPLMACYIPNPSESLSSTQSCPILPSYQHPSMMPSPPRAKNKTLSPSNLSTKIQIPSNHGKNGLFESFSPPTSTSPSSSMPALPISSSGSSSSPLYPTPGPIHPHAYPFNPSIFWPSNPHKPFYPPPTNNMVMMASSQCKIKSGGTITEGKKNTINTTVASGKGFASARINGTMPIFDTLVQNHATFPSNTTMSGTKNSSPGLETIHPSHMASIYYGLQSNGNEKLPYEGSHHNNNGSHDKNSNISSIVASDINFPSHHDQRQDSSHDHLGHSLRHYPSYSANLNSTTLSPSDSLKTATHPSHHRRVMISPATKAQRDSPY